jgi:hypothetical protein
MSSKSCPICSRRARHDYAGNPALKLPSLEMADGTWFGTLNICRVLVRAAERKLDADEREASDPARAD